MCASRAAPSLHEPKLRLIWRGKHDLRMSNAIRLAYLRKGDRILGALQRFIIVAKYTYLTGDRRNRFRLVLEAGAVDQANRIVGADQRFDSAHDLAAREPVCQSTIELHRGKAHRSHVIVAKNINGERSKSGMGSGGSK